MEKVCLLCCFTYTPEESGQSSAAGGNHLADDLDKCPQLEEFCKDLYFELKGLVGALKTEWRDVSLCGDCLESVGKAVERGKAMQELEVDVRRLQLELLEKMRNLKGAVDKWQRELRKVMGIVKESEEDALLCRRKAGDCEEDAVVNFRKLIIQAPAKLKNYNGDLFKKVGGALDVDKQQAPRGTPMESLLGSLNPQGDLADEAVANAGGGGNTLENPDQVPEAGVNVRGEDSTPATASCSSSHPLQSNAQTERARRVSFVPFLMTYPAEPPPASSGVSVRNNEEDQHSDSDSNSSEDELFERVTLNALASGTCSPAPTSSSDSANKKLETLKGVTAGLVRPAPRTSSAGTTASTSVLDVSGIKSERVNVTENSLLESGSGGGNGTRSVRRSVRKKKSPVQSSSNGATTIGKLDIPRPASAESRIGDRRKKRIETRKALVSVKKFKQSRWPCKNCRIVCSSKSRLLAHMRVHTGERPYQCGQCDKAFSTKKQLKRHVKVVHQGLKPFACDLCQKKFSQNSNLQNHRRTHTGERPYACPLCQSRFAQKSTMVTHMRMHTGEMPYRCKDCGQRFRHGYQLKQHQRKEHHCIESAKKE